jgi:NADH-quinone oxidoreductase subunit L
LADDPPAIALAALSIAGGLLNLPFTSDLKFLEHWLVAEEGWSSIPFEHHVDVDTGVKITLAVLSALTAVAGLVVAYVVFERRRTPVDELEPEVLREAWFIDRAYAAVAAGPGRVLFDAAAWFDRTVIDGAVRGAGWIAQNAGNGLRVTQNGFVRSYALAVAVGAFVMVGYVLARMS